MAMHRIHLRLGCALALVIGVSSAHAQGTVKIGMINVLSGQFADAGAQLDNGAKTYMKMHGDTVAGKKIEIIRRDVCGPNPHFAKRHAHDLVAPDKTEPLTRLLLTPHAPHAAVHASASIYIFIPGGAQPAALGKAFAERGIDKKKTKILGSGETTAEAALKSMGDAGLDIITAWHYDYKLDNPLNREFVRVFSEMHGRNPDFFSIGGYDGMHAIYETLKKTKGNTDGEAMIAAAKGLKWASPRRPMSIDPPNRDGVQDGYIRRVAKGGD